MKKKVLNKEKFIYLSKSAKSLGHYHPSVIMSEGVIITCYAKKFLPPENYYPPPR